MLAHCVSTYCTLHYPPITVETLTPHPHLTVRVASQLEPPGQEQVGDELDWLGVLRNNSLTTL